MSSRQKLFYQAVKNNIMFEDILQSATTTSVENKSTSILMNLVMQFRKVFVIALFLNILVIFVSFNQISKFCYNSSRLWLYYDQAFNSLFSLKTWIPTIERSFSCHGYYYRSLDGELLARENYYQELGLESSAQAFSKGLIDQQRHTASDGIPLLGIWEVV